MTADNSVPEVQTQATVAEEVDRSATSCRPGIAS